MAGKWLTIAAGMMITLGAVSAAGAVTCDDVRSLTRAEQEYWAKRLHITAEQRHEIWRACYGSDPHHRPRLMPVNSR